MQCKKENINKFLNFLIIIISKIPWSCFCIEMLDIIEKLGHAALFHCYVVIWWNHLLSHEKCDGKIASVLFCEQ